MPDVYYYVSAQNGDDNNNGTSPSTPWKTLTKAASSITVSQDGNTYVIIGPGVYRERPTSPSGYSSTYKLVWRGDPMCRFLTNDKPGRVRITGCDSDEYPTTGKVLNWSSASNVELWDVEVDGSLDDYAVYGIGVCRNVYATSYNGFYVLANGRIYDCIAVAAYFGFRAAGSLVHFYRCISLALINFSGSYGSYVAYNCIAVGGQFHFCDMSNYAYNCAAIGTYSANNFGECYNCVGINTVFKDSSATAHRNVFIGYGTDIKGKDNYVSYNPNAPVYGVSSNAIRWKHFTINYPVLKSLFNLIDLKGLPVGGICSPVNESTSYYMDLTAARYYQFTTTVKRYCYGVGIYIKNKSSSGTITAAVQRDSGGGNWVTEASKTLSVSDMTDSDWARFFWDDRTTVTLNTGTNYRVAVSADGDASGTTIYGSASTTPSVRVICYRDDHLQQVTTELYGFDRPANNYRVNIGPFILPQYEIDYQEYYSQPPSIKLMGVSALHLELPAKGGEQVSVSYYVKHNAASGYEPQLAVTGKTISTTTATHTGGSGNWQQLTVTVTPEKDEVLIVRLLSRDENGVAYFSDPSVS